MVRSDSIRLINRCGRALALAAILLMSAARAQGAGAAAFKFLGLAEPLVPDLRVEVGGPIRLVLSWPIHPFAYLVTGEALSFAASPFVEPQLRLSDGAGRLLVGARAAVVRGKGVAGVGLAVEAAGQGERGGFGGSVGVGLTLVGEPYSEWSASSVTFLVRRTWAPGGEIRHDLCLDFTFPVSLLFE